MTSVSTFPDHPLLRPVRAVAARARRWAVATGAARTVAAVLAASLVVAVVDAGVRPAGPAYSWLAFGVVWITAAAGVWRWLWPALRGRADLVAVARRVQRINPHSGDRFAAAVGLLAAGPQGGSEQLRTLAIDQAAAGVGGLDFRAVLDRRPAFRAAGWLAAVAAVAAATALAVPETAERAVRRTLAPWRPVAWPRADELELLGVPSTVAVGADVPVTVVDRQGTLPRDLVVEVAGPEGTATPALKRAADGASAEAVIDAVEADFRVRAVGGDDRRMPWHAVRVSEPPRVVEAIVEVIPPEYSGLARQTTDQRRLRVLDGTELRLQAMMSRPIRSARLVAVDGAAGDAAEPLAVGAVAEAAAEAEEAETRRVAIEGVRPQRSTELALVTNDPSGLVSASDWRLRVEVIGDAAPRLRWIAPREDVTSLPDGEVDLVWRASDDLAIRTTGIELARSDAGPEESSESKWVRETDAPDATVERSERLVLETLPDLQPGVVLTVRAVATDSAGQTRRSEPRRITLVTADVLQQEASRSRRQAVESLREAARGARVASEQTEAGATRLEASPDDPQPAVDRLRIAATSLRRASERLAAEGSSAATRLREAAERLEAGGADPQAAAELAEAADEMERLAAESLDPARRQLSELAEEAASGDDDGGLSDRVLQSAAEQRATAEQIERAVRRLGREEGLRQAAAELGDLLDQQQRLADRVAESSDEPDDEAERQAARQRELARRLAAVIDRLAQQEDTEASAASRALGREVAEMLEASGAVSEMRNAADAVAAGRTGQAEASQRAAARAMAEARDALAGRDASTRARATSAGLRDAAERLRELRGDQQAFLDQLAGAADAADSGLAEALAERAAALAEQLDGMAAPGAADAVREAERADRTAGEQLGEDAPDAARDAAATADEALADAQAALERRVAQATRDEQTSELAELARRVTGLFQTQQRVVAGIEQAAADDAAPPEPMAQLAREETEVARATRELAPRTESLPGFGPLLERAADDLEAAAAGLARGRVDAAVRSRATDARERLGQMAEALQQGAEGNRQAEEQQQAEESPESEPDAKPPGPSIASLHLLRARQAWLRERTAQLGERPPADAPRDWERARGRLADEQQALAEMARQWIERAAERGEAG